MRKQAALLLRLHNCPVCELGTTDAKTTTLFRVVVIKASFAPNANSLIRAVSLNTPVFYHRWSRNPALPSQLNDFFDWSNNNRILTPKELEFVVDFEIFRGHHLNSGSSTADFEIWSREW
jgi:hypothetical protein